MSFKLTVGRTSILELMLYIMKQLFLYFLKEPDTQKNIYILFSRKLQIWVRQRTLSKENTE